MNWSNNFIPTLREDPSEAELISHKLMIRAGMIRKLSSGVYSYLPLGWRTIRKVENIVRQEMDMAGSVEIHMPMVCPSELWKESNRWNAYGDSLWKIKDRNNNSFCLGPTHEEVVTDLVRRDIQSYKQLPINLYQIQTKIRDEVRPRFGLMRAREFIMKDAYSFHTSEESLDETYKTMYNAYSKIFSKCGLNFKVVEADSGQIGGNESHEFMVLALSGEDAIANCTSCKYAANVEKAIGTAHKKHPGETDKELKIVDTPNIKTISELTKFFNTKPEIFLKTLIYMVDNKLVAVVLKGDDEICETKLTSALGEHTRLASDEEILNSTGVETGFLGPINLEGVSKIIVDNSLKGIKDGITGANQKDKHYTGVSIDRDFTPNEYMDLRTVKKGDLCPKCGNPLELLRGIETGHIFKLGTKYSEIMKAKYLDSEKNSSPSIMGCYGIGVTRIVAASIEQNHDKDGIIWPVSIAPYQVVISNLDPETQEINSISNNIYKELTDNGVDVLVDDRKERPGIKFKDADLIGFPIRIVIGNRGIKEGIVEIKERKSGNVTKLAPDQCAKKTIDILKKIT